MASPGNLLRVEPDKPDRTPSNASRLGTIAASLDGTDRHDSAAVTR